MKIEMQRDGRFFLNWKNVSGPSNPPDESAQHVSKTKSLSDELFLHFFFESSQSYRVFFFPTFLHDSPGESIQKRIGTAQYSDR